MPRDHDSTLIQFLVVVAIAVASVLWNWLKRRYESEDSTGSEEESAAAPPPLERSRKAAPSTPPSTRRISWEEELRRLLEGEEPAPQPKPPPVIVAPQPRPPRPAPKITARMPPPVARPRPSPPRSEAEEAGLPVKLPSLAESSKAYQRAGQLDIKVAQRMRAAGAHLKVHGRALQLRPVHPEVRAAKSMLRKRESLRSALIASIVLGTPKALESDPWAY